MMHRAIGLSLATLLCAVAAQAANEQAAQAHVELLQRHDADCQERGGKRQYIRNTHAARTVQAYVVRFFMNVQQADRSVLVLKPHAKAQKLGCTRVFDAPQTWEVIGAEFLRG